VTNFHLWFGLKIVIHPQTLEVHNFHIWHWIRVIFMLLDLFCKDLQAYKRVNFSKTKILEVQRLFSLILELISINFWVIHNFSILGQIDMFTLMNFWWRALLVWEYVGHLETKFFGGLFQGIGWVLANILLVSIHFCPLSVKECHVISKCGGFEFMSWVMCKNHKSGDLCCIICASPFVFVRLHLLHVSMLVELSYAFTW